MWKWIGVATVLATTVPAFADSMNVALKIGTVLASENHCGLEYDQAEIQNWIEKYVKADDMEFPSTLQMMISGTEYQLNEQSASQKTAHCKQIARVAKSYNFIK